MPNRKANTETHFLDRPDVASLDRSRMFDYIRLLPQQLKSSLTLCVEPLPDLTRTVSNVLVCGLGGSAIGGAIASRLVRDQLTVPLQVSRGIRPPAYVSSGTLAFVISYTGATAETLAVFRDLRRAGAQIVAVSSGGFLTEQASLHRVPLIRLPAGMPPRSAIGYTSVPLLRQLTAFGLCQDPAERLEAASRALEISLSQLDMSSPYRTNQAKQIADSLSGRVVSVYGSQGNLDVVARRWAGQIAENGKQIAFWNAVPEMLHNEIVGWSHPRNFLKMRTCVLLRDSTDPPRIGKLFDDLGSQLLAQQSRLSVQAPGGDRWEKIFGLVLLGDLVSCYVALLNGEDPTPISAIKAHKARLDGQAAEPEVSTPVDD